ncbi:MAG: hypothetical protein ACI81L_002342 [Verrucomicrobiales bacterium]|jgi:hypothetical protein
MTINHRFATIVCCPRNRLAVAGIAAAVILTACGGESVPAAVPFADDSPIEPGEVVSLDVSATTAPTTTDPSASDKDTEATTTTTTEAPPAAPIEPTLLVECATNPPQVSVSFVEDVETPLDWELSVARHPGGSGLASIVDVLSSGTEVPIEDIVHDVEPNDLVFTVLVTNESGVADATVSVLRYSGCPTSSSVQARVVDSIDCVSGVFHFSASSDSAIVVNSVVVHRWKGLDTGFAVNSGGNYWVPDWDGPAELKAIVTFTDPTGTHEEHIGHRCFDDPFGSALGDDYEVCADEALKIAYPGALVSTVELYGPEGNSCGFFRRGAEDGRVHHDVTLESLGGVTLEQAVEDVLPPGPWVIANITTVSSGAFVDTIGATKGGARAGYELAWTDAPDDVRRKVWLIEANGKVWRLEANLQGLAAIDAMAQSIQFMAVG